MAQRILQLRIALLAALFKGKASDVLKRTIGVLIFFGSAYVLAKAPLWISAGNQEFREDIDNGILLGLAVAVFVVPLFVPRWNLDVRSFSAFAGSHVSKVSGILLTAIFTIPAIWVFFWATVWIYTRRDSIESMGAVVPFMVVTVVLLLVVPRFTASLSNLLFDTERRRNARDASGVLLLLTVLPILIYFFFALGSKNQQQHVGQIAEQIFFFTPVSALTTALNTEVESMPGALAVTILIALAFVLLAFLTMLREVSTIPRPGVSAIKEAKLGWFAVFPSKPAGAVGARSMIYWLKDPRYRVSLIAIPIIPFLVVAVLKFVGVSVDVLAFFPLPLVLILLAWMTHNDVSHDSTAFWLHVSSGLKGWQDRYGRITPVLMIGIPILLFGTGVSALILGDWRLIPSFFALGFVALSASLAVSSVSSVLLPYPATRPGESPFMQPQWQGAGSGFAQTTSFAVSVALTTPIIWVIAMWAKQPDLDQQLLLAGGAVVYGITLLIFGIVVGGAIFNMRSSDILSKAQVYD